jgi:hypothetical protein
MSTAPYESDRPTQDIAKDALNAVAACLDEWEGSDWATSRPTEQIRDVVELASARLRMARQMRPSRRTPRWLAKVTSFAFPRTFATTTQPPRPDAYATDEEFIAASAEWGRKHHHLCFTVQIAEGGKAAVGREVEVQVPDEDAERLARQILRLVEWRKKNNPGIQGDEVT